jgi:hypothetical protein
LFYFLFNFGLTVRQFCLLDYLFLFDVPFQTVAPVYDTKLWLVIYQLLEYFVGLRGTVLAPQKGGTGVEEGFK